MGSRHRPLPLPWGALALCLAACSSGPSDDDPDGGDGAADGADGGGDGGEIAPPGPPAPPVLTPCPPGWDEISPGGPDDVTACEPWPDGGPAVLTPCPDGWRELPPEGPGDVAVCEPWPEGGPVDCGVDEAHFPGEPGCVRIGSACPAGDWADDLPTDRPVRRVRPGEPAGGDGSEAAPFGTIAEALIGAPADVVIALSKGTFDEAVLLVSTATLWGACVAETELASSIPSDTSGTVTVRASGVELRNLRLSGRRPAVWVDRRGGVHLRDVVISEAELISWWVLSGTATADTVVVRDARALPDGSAGRGLEVSGGAQVEVVRGVFERNRELSIAAFEAGTRVALTGVAIRDTLAAAGDGRGGRAISVQEGARLEATAVTIDDNRDTGVTCQGAGTAVVLGDVVVRGTRERVSDGQFGYGISAGLGGAVEATRVRVEANRQVGVRVAGSGTSAVLGDALVRGTLGGEGSLRFGTGIEVVEDASATVERTLLVGNRHVGIAANGAAVTVTLADVAVRDTEAQESDGLLGYGLAVQYGATLTGDRVLLAGNRGAGIALSGTGSSAVLGDLVVRGTRSEAATGEFGRGVTVSGGSRAELRRALFAGNRETGLFVSEADARILAEDVVLRDTEGRESDGAFGRGIAAWAGGRIEAARIAVAGSREVGVLVSDEGTTLDVEDLAIRDTLGRTDDGMLGRGLNVQLGAYAVAVRVVIERNREAGVWAGWPATEVWLRDAVVRETLPRDCVGTTCADPAGMGLVAIGAAQIDVTGFAIADNHLCGLQIALGMDDSLLPFPAAGTIDLHLGEVSGHPIGANVQDTGFEIGRLTDRVIYRDNERDLDTTVLPVPGSDV